METVSGNAEDVSKIAGAVVAVAMAGTALMWVGSSIKSLITDRKIKRNAKKVEEMEKTEQTVA